MYLITRISYSWGGKDFEHLGYADTKAKANLYIKEVSGAKRWHEVIEFDESTLYRTKDGEDYEIEKINMVCGGK